MKANEGRRLTFRFIGQSFRECLYFQHFFLTPAIGTFDMNTYKYGKKWMFTRLFTLYIFWWEFAIEWQHGLAEKIIGK